MSRTGPFLALFTCIQDIDEGRCFPDLNKIIRVLRTKRRHVIQDMNQLKFLYETLLYYVQDFLVKRKFTRSSLHLTLSVSVQVEFSTSARSPIILSPPAASRARSIRTTRPSSKTKCKPSWTEPSPSFNRRRTTTLARFSSPLQ